MLKFLDKNLNKIYKLFKDSKEKIRSVYLSQDIKEDRYLKLKDIRINTDESLDGYEINREYVFKDSFIDKESLDCIYFSKFKL